ncbi:Metallo-hydrolase/oxidoreductase [Pisolithus croceorrhizus]|nr:Metallo-hydrolase/oxidoreductase [Pisolithus croceorrhizus]KAI6099519.1 Metallo-hydrolase/oxidoreductase [Pisolithus croceorrhizus]
MSIIPAFKARRLTSSTFLIIEWDGMYNEHPFIYARIVSAVQTMLILDTGCGGASNNPRIGVSLRKFIETVPIEENERAPLNPGGRLAYVVIQSHCHYDHILGMEAFTSDSVILGSGHDPTFTSQENLAAHSLCAILGIGTPSYKLNLVPHLHDIVSVNKVSLGVTVLHTPGHTPDGLALWDANESMLYVGDTRYEDDPIIFPEEGNLPDWFATVGNLLAFVCKQPDPDNVRINCGHAAVMKLAIEVLRATKEFMKDVVPGTEPLRRRFQTRGQWVVEYKQKSGRFSPICPERLVLEAMKDISV